MSGVSITGLNPASTLTGSEIVPIVQSGTTAKTTLNAMPYVPAGTGAVTTTVQSKLRETVSVKDFGAVGDGTTDDTAAIQAAITASSGKILFVPKGTYKISSTINFGTSVSVQGEGAKTSIFYATHSGVAVRVNLPVSLNPATDTYSQQFSDFGITCNTNTTFGLWLMRCIFCTFNNIYIKAPQAVSSGFSGFRVSGAMYLNTFENCVVDTIEETANTTAIAWWIGNGLNEVENAYALTNDNTFITCRGVRFSKGFDVDYASGCTFINCNAEQNSVASFHVRGNYNTFIGPWVESGSIVFDRYIPTNGSGGTGSATAPANNNIFGNLPFDAVLTYSIRANFIGCQISTINITANASGTQMNNCFIVGSITNNGSDGDLRYSIGGAYRHVVQNGSNTVSDTTYNNGDTKILMNGNQYIESLRFGNLVFSSDNKFNFTGTSPQIILNKTTDPGSSSANQAYLWIQDNGSGKLQLAVKFPTGATQVLATQP